MSDIKQFMKENDITNIKINIEALTKEQIAMYHTSNQIILHLVGIAYYTDSFMTYFGTIAPAIIPEKWNEKKIEKRVVDISIKIKDYVSTGDGFLRSTAIIVNLLEKIIDVTKRIQSVFGEYNILTNYLQLYKTFAEIVMKNLTVLLYNAGGSDHFGEARKFVNKHIMKHFTLNNDPKNLLDCFVDLTAILASLSKATAEGGWETLKEEVLKHGGIFDGEEPTD